MYVCVRMIIWLIPMYLLNQCHAVGVAWRIVRPSKGILSFLTVHQETHMHALEHMSAPQLLLLMLIQASIITVIPIPKQQTCQPVLLIIRLKALLITISACPPLTRVMVCAHLMHTNAVCDTLQSVKDALLQQQT